MGALMGGGGGGGGGPKYGGPTMAAATKQQESPFTPSLPTGDPQAMSARQEADFMNMMLQRNAAPPTAEENLLVVGGDPAVQPPALPREDPQALSEEEAMAIRQLLGGGL